MRISELIEALQRIKDSEGDLPVVKSTDDESHAEEILIGVMDPGPDLAKGQWSQIDERSVVL